MATMLRSAAMTLLSKTLLTFLYKYLSDVDVEGVEMPSLYGSTEGSGSGWGVRLSNVKLREGAELMMLPGGIKAKEKPKASGTKESGNAASKVGSKKSKDAPNSPRKANARERREERINSEASVKGRFQEERKEGENGKLAPTEGTKGSKKAAQVGSFDTSPTAEMAHETLPDASFSSIHEVEVSRPETPTQQSTISFLSCFGPSADAKANEASKASASDAAEQREQDSNLSSEASSQEEREDEIRHLAKDDLNGIIYLNVNGHAQSNSDATTHMKAPSNSAQKPIRKKQLQLSEIPDLLVDNDDRNSEEDEDVLVEEEAPQSLPMALRIGQGASIGTLDVRLVGRELHVLVEDALLTLEVFTKQTTMDETGPPKHATVAENSEADLPPGVNTEKPAPTPTPAADINELKTTGERVLAKNAIARIFSSIPHLFLRDIVVRIVVLGDDQGKNDSTQVNHNNASESSADVIVDIGVGLLSVTEGDEFVSPFNDDDDADGASSGEEDAAFLSPPLNAQTSQSGPSPENEYLERRIRTGKGANGGLWLNVVTPKYERISNKLFAPVKRETVSHAMEHRWARHAWLESTRNCVLRCSGLDIRARIFLGTKKELALANTTYTWFYDDLSTYEGIDHTLYGFDHVVPGPTPHTLPPLVPAPHCNTSRSMDEGDDNGNLRSQVYKTDRNGIQSSKIESCFYRVARGMIPTRCTLEHLPCENCNRCWEVSGKRTGEVPEQTHPLDAYTPMPGLVLSVSMRDPLEMNVDRASLDGLGLLMGLFKKEPETLEPTVMEPKAGPETEDEDDMLPVEEVVPVPQSNRGYFSSFFFGSAKSEEGDTKSRRFSNILSSRRRKVKPPPAFPAYMKPESIEIIGVFIAEVRLRIHIMKEDDELRHNAGLSFCYWDIKGDCLTVDQQTLSSEKKYFNDLRLDLGLLEVNEFKGVDKKILCSAGVPTTLHDSVSLEALGSGLRGARPPWPTNASALLDIPPTLESLVFENRERHGIQLRMLQVTKQPVTVSEKTRTLINFQLGVCEINLPFTIGGVINEIRREAMKSLAMSNAEDSNQEAPGGNEDTVTQYRAQLDGGRVRMIPSIDVRLPLTRLAGNICPESGFSMETLLERVDFSYGESSKKVVPTANSARGVSLKRFPTLPEPIRLRILLFLDDLEPLEQALGIRRQPNSFLRCNAVNKGLGKIAVKRFKKRDSDLSLNRLNRRQELLNKLLTLDDEALESLWSSHQRKQRKVKRSNSIKKPR